MALKRLSTVAETATKKSADEAVSVEVPGRIVSRFNLATENAKNAEAIQKEARAKLLAIGLKALFDHNVQHPTAPATSIKLIQANKPLEGDESTTPIDGDGEVARLTFQNKYSAADADTADHLFEDLLRETNVDLPKAEKLSINNFMQETVSAGFDSKVFQTGENGEFNQKVFDAYLAAIEKTTAELVKKGMLAAGTKVPLAITKKVLPLGNFHAERWTNFPSTVAQQQIFEVVSNTVTVTPVKA